ncbi:hypothetical protein MHBO_003000 [Bonamia ostreae]|uniref:BPL/LPL catalytic domain-containing protein n=1 Tax=Bonamia ostreae TaxID=126728 RepID=A0ABV2AP67_9EUKA
MSFEINALFSGECKNIKENKLKFENIKINPFFKMADFLQIIQKRNFDFDYFFTKFSKNKLFRHFLHSDLITSTQTLLANQLSWLPDGSVFIAHKQINGVGRKNNVWESPEGCLMFSFKIIINKNNIHFLQYFVTLMLLNAIKKTDNFKNIYIKWPNDIYFDKKIKIGGVLCNRVPGKHNEYVCGIGLNVYNKSPTTCLSEISTSAKLPKHLAEDILFDFLTIFSSNFEKFEENGFCGYFLKKYYQFWMHSDQKVNVRNRDFVIKGIDEFGYLKVVDDLGEFSTLMPDGNRFDFLNGLIIQK